MRRQDFQPLGLVAQSAGNPSPKNIKKNLEKHDTYRKYIICLPYKISKPTTHEN